MAKTFLPVVQGKTSSSHISQTFKCTNIRVLLESSGEAQTHQSNRLGEYRLTGEAVDMMMSQGDRWHQLQAFTTRGLCTPVWAATTETSSCSTWGVRTRDCGWWGQSLVSSMEVWLTGEDRQVKQCLTLVLVTRQLRAVQGISFWSKPTLEWLVGGLVLLTWSTI